LNPRSSAFYCAWPLMVVLILPIDARSVPVYSYFGRCGLQQYQVPDPKPLNSCSACAINDQGILSCKCSDSLGQSYDSSLAIYECPKGSYSFPKCADEVGVLDGKLSCRRISEESTYDERGCFACSKAGFYLRCDCEKEGRLHVSTELDLSDCYAPISNCRGKLTCGLCKEPATNSWIWWQATAVGASAVIVAIVIVKTFFWKTSSRRL